MSKLGHVFPTGLGATLHPAYRPAEGPAATAAPGRGGAWVIFPRCRSAPQVETWTLRHPVPGEPREPSTRRRPAAGLAQAAPKFLRLRAVEPESGRAHV